jgi:hypothetical protein
MNFWRPLAIALGILLSISCVGFAYLYIQGKIIPATGITTNGMQPKVVTLLKKLNCKISFIGFLFLERIR